MTKPTIRELEEILSGNAPASIEILPDGQVRAVLDGPIIACVCLAPRAFDANGKEETVTVRSLENAAHIGVDTDPVSFNLPRDSAERLAFAILKTIYPPYGVPAAPDASVGKFEREE